MLTSLMSETDIDRHHSCEMTMEGEKTSMPASLARFYTRKRREDSFTLDCEIIARCVGFEERERRNVVKVNRSSFERHENSVEFPQKSAAERECT